MKIGTVINTKHPDIAVRITPQGVDVIEHFSPTCKRLLARILHEDLARICSASQPTPPVVDTVAAKNF